MDGPEPAAPAPSPEPIEPSVGQILRSRLPLVFVAMAVLLACEVVNLWRNGMIPWQRGPLLQYALYSVCPSVAFAFGGLFLTAGARTRPRGLALFVLLAAWCGLVLLVWSSMPNRHGERKDLLGAAGDRIVIALMAYEKDNGRAPDTLQALVPRYLDAADAATFPEFSFGRGPSPEVRWQVGYELNSARIWDFSPYSYRYSAPAAGGVGAWEEHFYDPSDR